MYISFIYRINNSPNEFGKVANAHISDDYDGVDYEVQFIFGYIRKSLEEHLQIKIDDIKIGILGITDEFSSYDEKDIFDLYIKQVSMFEYECYYKGVQIQ